MRLVLAAGSAAHASTPVAESIRTTPPGRTPRPRSCEAIRQAFSTMPVKRARSSALPIADPPPTGGHTGATTEPTSRFLERILSASRLMSSVPDSMLVWGSARKRSTPSNFTPSIAAAAVKSSIVSRSIAGSAPGLPLPTRPHMALCNFGKLLRLGIRSLPGAAGSCHASKLFVEISRPMSICMVGYRSHIAASPKNAKKPTTSVTVVTNTADAIAGSTSKRSSARGMSIQERAAARRLMIMAAPITSPN